MTAVVEVERARTAHLEPEQPVKEEVVVEPDLPVEEPSPTPAGPSPEAPSPASDDEPELELEDSLKEYERLLASMAPDEPVYVAGDRGPRLKVGRHTLAPGDVVPGAHFWPRREAYERLGRIVLRRV